MIRSDGLGINPVHLVVILLFRALARPSCRRRTQGVDHAVFWIANGNGIIDFEVAVKFWIIFKPPKCRLREKEPGRAFFPEALQVTDCFGAIPGMIAGVNVIETLGEVPAKLLV